LLPTRQACTSGLKFADIFHVFSPSFFRSVDRNGLGEYGKLHAWRTKGAYISNAQNFLASRFPSSLGPKFVRLAGPVSGTFPRFLLLSLVTGQVFDFVYSIQ
jgi:hypothetical protein